MSNRIIAQPTATVNESEKQQMENIAKRIIQLIKEKHS
jgi:hypothetical protein